MPSADKQLTILLPGLHHISAAQKIFFIENLHVTLKAGLSIIEALKILELQIENPAFKKIIGQIQKQIETGKALSESLARFPKLFPAVYIKMINAGEATGKLDESLKEIVSQMRKNYELKNKVRGAMIYPIIILIAMMGVGIEMIVFVLPKLLDIFKEADVPLPLPTRILIYLSELLVQRGWLILLVSLLTALGLTLLYRRQEKFKLFCHKLAISLPVFGRVTKQINLARMSLVLSSLLKSAVPIVSSFEICSEVMSNLLYKNALIRVSQDIKNGLSIAENLADKPKLFPPLVTQMILIGEKTGMVENMLEELSGYYEAEVDRLLKNLSTIIEPFLILFLGLVVGAMAISVIMPLYSLSQGI